MGGIAVAETLLQLERLEAYKEPADSAKSLHLFIEAAKRSYADRRSVGADPDFYGDKVPAGAVDRLLSGGYLTTRKPLIDRARATPSKEFSLDSKPKESPETTHFSVLDRDGNAVSCTYTLSAAFGAKIVVPGTGVMFSNSLGAFSPEAPNDAAPGKHMASSMSPTIVSRNGQVEIVVGSPGGDTIPNTVSQVLINLIDYKMPVDEAVKRPRVHHQLLPDEVRTEAARQFPEPIRKELEKLGHKLVPSPASLGDAKVIVRDPKTGKAWGFSDQREGGPALAPKSNAKGAKAPKKAK
jgi:gamma-glutamyltranspeptidase/glutathione hydrolase